MGSQPPEAGPPLTRRPVDETTRMPVVEPPAPVAPPSQKAPPPDLPAATTRPVPAPPPAEPRPGRVEGSSRPPDAAGLAADPTLISAGPPAPAADSALTSAEPTPVEAEPASAADPTLTSAGPPAAGGEAGPAAGVAGPAPDPSLGTEAGPASTTDPNLVTVAELAESSPPGGGSADATSGSPDGPSRRAAFTVAGTAAAKAALTEVREESAWVLGASAILVAFAIGWFVGILLSFRHAHGYSARDRILQFFEPGSLTWALAILLALTLITIARKFDPDPGRRSRMHELLPAGLLLAGAAVVLSSVVGILVQLTNFGNGIDAAFAGLFGSVAVLLMGAAATWWAHIELGARRQASKPSG